MTTGRLLAYQAHDGSDGWAIVYASNSASARRYAANQMGVEWEDIEWCRRAQSLDKYSPGPVPLEALVSFGWRFECHGCGRHVDDETQNPVYIGNLVFHSPWCRIDWTSENFFRQSEEKRISDELVAFLTMKYPGITIKSSRVYANVTNGGSISINESEILFAFPWGIYPARYRKSDRYYPKGCLYISKCDETSWDTFFTSLATTPYGVMP